MVKNVIKDATRMSVKNAIGFFGFSWSAYWATHLPSNLAVVWVNDYARMTWDIGGTAGAYEIWESINGGVYTLVATTAVGASSYNNYTSQNGSVNLKIRGVGGGKYSDFTNIVNIITPLVFKTDQSTLNQAKFANFNVTAGKTINVDWGDGTSNNYTGNNASITKDYASVGNPYYIKLTGDVNNLIKLNAVTWLSCYGDITKWIIPTSCNYVSFLGNLKIMMTGNPQKWIEKATVDLRFANTDLSGDMSAVNCGNAYYMNFQNNKGITDLPRGTIKANIGLNFSGCSVNQAKLEAWLSYVHAYLDANPPTANSVYTLNTSRMGRIDPSNADVLGIIAAYNAVPKTISVLTYWPTIAYSDSTSKVIIPLTTYDGHGETVHPSVIDCGAVWNGYRYWMADTPYYNNDQDFERPSIWASNDGLNWVVPDGATNPVVDVASHADPDLFFENDTLYLIYRTGADCHVGMVHSHDGITWSAEVIIGHPDGGDTQGMVSPSIVKVGATYYIYYLNNTGSTTKSLRRRSCATIDGTYGTPEEVILTEVNAGGWWHLDVLMVGGVFYLCAGEDNSVQSFFHIAKSVDGINFTRDTNSDPAIYNSLLDEYRFYHPSMMFIGSQLYVYYSCKITNKWTVVRIKVYLI